jgi:integrase
MGKLKVREIKGKPSTPWMVAVPKAFTQTKRVRKFFQTRGEALDYISRIFRSGYVRADIRQSPVEIGKATLSQCVTQFLVVRYEPGETNNDTLKQERQILGSFTSRYGNTPIDAFTHREIETWLRTSCAGKADQTRANYYAIAKRFFKWCHEKEELIDRNPFIKVDEKLKRVDRTEPEVLTPEQMRICLEATMGKDVALLAYVVLGGFAGIRTAEILRMNWEEINWTDGYIHVLRAKKVSRWRPRNVDILPPFRRHLKPFALKCGPIFEGESESIREQKLMALRAHLTKALGLTEWPENCLRHSFASYHVPIHNDYPELSIQMGHANPNMTRYKYGVLRPRAIAERWWSL